MAELLEQWAAKIDAPRTGFLVFHFDGDSVACKVFDAKKVLDVRSD